MQRKSEITTAPTVGICRESEIINPPMPRGFATSLAPRAFICSRSPFAVGIDRTTVPRGVRVAVRELDNARFISSLGESSEYSRQPKRKYSRRKIYLRNLYKRADEKGRIGVILVFARGAEYRINLGDGYYRINLGDGYSRLP